MRIASIIALTLTFAAIPKAFGVNDLPRRATTPRETYPNVDVIYDSVTTPRGERLRTIITKPHEVRGKLPVIFVAGWLSCDTVEAPPDKDPGPGVVRHDATGLAFREIAQTPGFCFFRVDKQGVGDSEGNCAETDFESELAGYRAAFRALKNYDFIDTNQVFILGISNGGGFGPLVPETKSEQAQVRGYAVVGGWVKTWFEHMLEIERRRFALMGKSPGEVSDRMKGAATLYHDWLIKNKSIDGILGEHPELANLWPEGKDHAHLYGRPLAFYQQLQNLDLAAAWSQLKVPTLVLHGQFDWIMSREDHELIAEYVNANHPGAARFVEVPDMGHTFQHYLSFADAFHGKEAQFDRRLVQLVIDWLNEQQTKQTAPEHGNSASNTAGSSSPEAVRAWEDGVEVKKTKGPMAAIPFFQRAIDLDPEFSDALFQLGLIYRNLGQEKRATELYKRAFATRARVNLRDQLAIAGQYYSFVTGEHDKAIETFQQWVKAYPRDWKAVLNLGAAYGDFHDFAQAIRAFRRVSRLNPKDVVSREDLMELLTAKGDFNEARKVFQEMQRAKLDDDSPHIYMYSIAALERDAMAMEKEVGWFADKTDFRHEILSEQADLEAYTGHLARARELSGQAVAAALSVDNKEQAAAWQLNAAWREELFGNETESQDQLARARSTFSDSREINAIAGILFARNGADAKANAVAAELELQYPRHDVVQSYWLPCIRAQLFLAHSDPVSALRELKKAVAYDFLVPQVLYHSHMPSIVLRAEAYSALGRHKEAAEQWHKIISHPGSVQLSATAPIARLRLAQVYAHEPETEVARTIAKARAAYNDFLSLWNNADSNIPVLKQAKSEYSQLQSAGNLDDRQGITAKPKSIK